MIIAADRYLDIYIHIQGVFLTGTPPPPPQKTQKKKKKSKYKKVNLG